MSVPWGRRAGLGTQASDAAEGMSCEWQGSPSGNQRSRSGTYVGQEDGVAADPAQADEELQRDPQVVTPLLVVGQSVPRVLHFRSWDLVSILSQTRLKVAHVSVRVTNYWGEGGNDYLIKTTFWGGWQLTIHISVT